jgi:hypothetical protein
MNVTVEVAAAGCIGIFSYSIAFQDEHIMAFFYRDKHMKICFSEKLDKASIISFPSNELKLG